MGVESAGGGHRCHGIASKDICGAWDPWQLIHALVLSMHRIEMSRCKRSFVHGCPTSELDIKALFLAAPRTSRQFGLTLTIPLDSLKKR